MKAINEMPKLQKNISINWYINIQSLDIKLARKPDNSLQKVTEQSTNVATLLANVWAFKL